MTETGIWSQVEADLYHKYSPKLAAFLCRYLDMSIPVVDFGAGQGYYIAELASVGFSCVGVEGEQLKNFLHCPMIIHDLTKPLTLQGRQVLSFETWEHLPEWAEEEFVNTLVNSCKGKMIISCATPGQPGVGHINCRSHEYVINKIESRGFKLNTVDTAIIRRNVDKECDWLERNLLIFDRI